MCWGRLPAGPSSDRPQTPAMNLTPIRALTFDCYGTLIDWETGLSTILNAWAQSVDLPHRDDDLLEIYGRHEAAVEQTNPRLLYSDVVRETLHRIGNELGAPVTPGWADRLALSIGDWPAFPDSAEALLQLKTKFQLCILSNVDHASFAGSARQLIVAFDLVVTAQDVGAYKPSLINFSALLHLLAQRGIDRHQILHVAQSLFHDHAPARQLGLKTVWIDRRSGKSGFGSTPPPAADVQYDAVFPSLRAFAHWATA